MFSEFQLNILESLAISPKLFLSQKFLFPGQIVILAMAFGSGAIGNGRSLRNKKSLEEEVGGNLVSQISVGDSLSFFVGPSPIIA